MRASLFGSTKMVFALTLMLLSAILLSGCISRSSTYIGDDVYLHTTAKRDGWNLFIYSTDTPDIDYQVDTIRGFMSEESCLSAGHERTRLGGSYECGYKCKTQTSRVGDQNITSYDVCEEVCGGRGCRK